MLGVRGCGGEAEGVLCSTEEEQQQREGFGPHLGPSKNAIRVYNIF